MYRKFEHLENKLDQELRNLNEKYRQGAEMTEGDLKKADMLAHTAKCLMAYEKMLSETNGQPEYYQGNSYQGNNSYMSGNSYTGNSYMGNSYADGNSYARDSMGRYASRDMAPMSGHYPMIPGEPRW